MDKPEKPEIVYRKSARYPRKKTVSLTEEIDQKWDELSRLFKVEVVESVRPLIEKKIREMYAKVSRDKRPA